MRDAVTFCSDCWGMLPRHDITNYSECWGTLTRNSVTFCRDYCGILMMHAVTICTFEIAREFTNVLYFLMSSTVLTSDTSSNEHLQWHKLPSNLLIPPVRYVNFQQTKLFPPCTRKNCDLCTFTVVAFTKQYSNTNEVLEVAISTPHSAAIQTVQHLHLHSCFPHGLGQRVT